MHKLYIFLLSLFLSTHASALILEEQNIQKLQQMLSGKKVGFYMGSFDPIHKGHEQVVLTLLNKKLVDYVLIYPAWGGDTYKNRTNVNSRLKMLQSLYQDNPRVLITKLPPGQLQDLLTIESGEKFFDRPAVKSRIDGTEYIGILGSDSALWLDQKKLSIFMRGVKIPDKYKNHTTGGIMSLPVHKFIVFLREGDNLDSLNHKIGERPIIKILSSHYKDASSTNVRNKIKNHENVRSMLNPKIINIIKQNKLYE